MLTEDLVVVSDAPYDKPDFRNEILNHSLAAGSFAPLMFCAISLARKDDFPDRTITLVVPFSPGGGHDFVQRMIA